MAKDGKRQPRVVLGLDTPPPGLLRQSFNIRRSGLPSQGNLKKRDGEKKGQGEFLCGPVRPAFHPLAPSKSQGGPAPLTEPLPEKVSLYIPNGQLNFILPGRIPWMVA